MNTSPDQSDEALTETLRRLRGDTGSAGEREFHLALHRKLVAEREPAAVGWLSRWRETVARNPLLVWPTLGGAVGAATFAVLLLLNGGLAKPVGGTALTVPNGEPVAVAAGKGGAGAANARSGGAPPSGEVQPTYSVPAARVAVINLNFSADVKVEDVTFEVKLPDGLVFWSQGQALAERVFRWPGTLDAGENVLPIAVRGERAGLYRVAARAEIADQVIEREILLRVEGGV